MQRTVPEHYQQPTRRGHYIYENGIYNEPQSDDVFPCEEEVAVCRDWILKHCRFRQTINGRYSSYGHKHRVSHTIGRYVTNGAFIRAAVDLGYRYSNVSGGFATINAWFNMSIDKEARETPAF